MSTLKDDIIVTAALPYANSNLHLGHIRSTYIPSDIYVRYLRLRGENVVYICATDEHGTPIVVRAEKEGISPREVVDKYNESMYNDLKRIGCSFDRFGRTTSPIHYQLTQSFFERLLEKGCIYETDYEQLFCPNCNRFLPDRYVEGICPFCSGEKARGDQCEVCGRYLKPTELKSPYCVSCGTAPSIRKTEHWFFKLSAFQDFLEEWIEKNEELPPNVKNYATQWLSEGLKDWCITRDLNWGVPVPLEEAKGKVVYVWFDAPIDYISTTIEWAKSQRNPDIWKDFWQRDKSKIIHFIGKDIVYHHAIFWPAMLKAYGEYHLPFNIIAGGYLTLEGKKMSKSRGWMLEVDEYLKEFEADPLRYYLISIAPLSKDADFSWEEYARKNNDELADILGNFIHRSLTFTYQFFDKKIPESEASEEQNKILEEIKKAKRIIEDSIREQDFNRGLREIISLSAFGNRYLNEKEPWKIVKSDRKKANTCLFNAVQIVKALAIFLEPFLPFTAEKIWKTLNLQGSIHEQKWEEVDRKIPKGHALNKPEPLFKKIEAKKIEFQKKILAYASGKIAAY